MWPYFIIVFIIVLLQFRFFINTPQKMRFYIGITVLFLFAAMRGNGDGDYFAYLTRGSYILSLNDVFHNTTGMEAGYCFIAFIVNLFGLPKQFIIACMNLISLFCIGKFIKKYSPIWCLSLLIFIPLYLQFDMHAARTAVAISITTLGIDYIRKRKLFQFSIIILTASLFHTTALIAFVIYFLVNVKISVYIGMLVIAIEMVIVRVIGLDYMILQVLKNFKLDSVYNRFLTYASSEVYGYPFSLLDPRLWLVIAVFICSKYILFKPSKTENLFINCCYANCFFLIVFSEHTFVAYRISAFFNIYTIILIPMMIQKICRQIKNYNDSIIKKNIIITSLLLFFCIYAMGYVYTSYIVTETNYRIFIQG